MSELSAVLLIFGLICLAIPTVMALINLSIWLEYDKGVNVGAIFVGVIIILGCGLLITSFIVR